LSRETDSLAGASDTTGEPLIERRAAEAQEISPVTFYGKDYATTVDAEMYDFMPTAAPEPLVVEEIEEEGGDPKGSSAPGSALADLYEQFKTPLREPLNSQETPAPADTESTPPSDAPDEMKSGNGSATSSPESSTGKDKPPA
jgi:hypothetical protein